MIVIINNQGQYVHRIWRSLKYLNVESEIVENRNSVADIIDMNPSAIILSGGPYSVYEDRDILKLNNDLLELDYPILGICLGHQIIADHFRGKVEMGSQAEYAEVEITVKEKNDLFAGLDEKLLVWESHKDEITMLPEDFTCLASSDICELEAIKHNIKRIYGVQFHPEVHHTPKGSHILENFVKVCKN